MINRRGSTGYGQKFTDEITNDWGGKAYVDVMKGIDAALAKYPYIDGAKVAAAGGSYGGYMADWIATHTNRFKAIISHAGIYDKAAMYATEELWFEEHDMQGTPWTAAENYKKWSPSTYAADLGKYKTPTLSWLASGTIACHTRNRWSFSAHCSGRACLQSSLSSPTKAIGC